MTKMIVYDKEINGKTVELLYRIVATTNEEFAKEALAEAIVETGNKDMRIIEEEINY